jgi:phage terminase large subunit-like protein
VTAIDEPRDLSSELGYELEEMSLVERMAILSDEDREAVLRDLGEDVLSDPRAWLRPKQLAVLDDAAWLIAYLAGRGTGKTRVGSEWVIDQARVPATLISLIGRTVADVRDVMVNGESGIMALSPPDFRPDYVPSIRRLLWPNGSSALTFSADAPSQLRGTQSHKSWCDELAAWRHIPDDSGATSWDHARISTRLGAHPQLLVTTTPKRHPAIRELVERSRTGEGEGGRVTVHTGSSFENRANLSAEYLQTLRDLYAGTALERQELYGELVELVEDALWRESDIIEEAPPLTESTLDPMDLSRRKETGTEYTKIVGVDPGAMSTGDATGIVVIWATRERKREDRKAWVVEDLTAVRSSPEKWGAIAVDACVRHSRVAGGPCVIVAERNQGGEMVRSVIEAAAASAGVTVTVVLVHAAVSKRARAEPVVLAYRQNRVRHAPEGWGWVEGSGGGIGDGFGTGAELGELVDQMLSWEPASKWSPDRMDAMVHAVRSVLVDDRALMTLGSVRAAELGEGLESDASWRLPWRDRRDGTGGGRSR